VTTIKGLPSTITAAPKSGHAAAITAHPVMAASHRSVIFISIAGAYSFLLFSYINQVRFTPNYSGEH
jgi:hypothetical protein